MNLKKYSLLIMAICSSQSLVAMEALQRKQVDFAQAHTMYDETKEATDLLSSLMKINIEIENIVLKKAAAKKNENKARKDEELKSLRDQEAMFKERRKTIYKGWLAKGNDRLRESIHNAAHKKIDNAEKIQARREKQKGTPYMYQY
jgi:hypothetical protein